MTDRRTFTKADHARLEQLVASAAVTRQLADAASRNGLQALPAQTLLAIAASGVCGTSALRSQLQLSAPKLSDALKVLRLEQLIEERPDERDGRVRRYALTKAGTEKVRQFLAALQQNSSLPSS
jgi:DNA-binding MarR family transcriptional regulator